MLWRSRARTWLTFSSIAVAFFLFTLLQSVMTVFGGAHGLGLANSLVVTARHGFGLPMPIAHRSRIEALDGVVSVSPVEGLGQTWFQDPKNVVNLVGVDPVFLAGD